MKRGLLSNEQDDVGFLMPHQVVGVERIVGVYEQKRYPGILLHDEMGLGKTIQAVEATCRRLKLSPVLIVVPSACIATWETEIKKWFSKEFDDIRVFAGTGVSHSSMMNQTNKTLFITTYETLRNQYKYYITKNLPIGNLSVAELQKLCRLYGKPSAGDDKGELLKTSRNIDAIKRAKMTGVNVKGLLCSAFVQQQWGCIIMDEVHNIKNPNSSTTKAVGFMSARFRIGLTGTPVMNSGRDLITIIQYGLGMLSVVNWERLMTNPNGPECQEILANVCFGRTKDAIPELVGVLPKRQKHNEHIELEWTDDQQKLAYWNEKQRTLSRLDNKEIKSSWENIQALRQICLHQNTISPFNGECVHTWSPATHHAHHPWIRKRIVTLLLCTNTMPKYVRQKLIEWFVYYENGMLQPSPKMMYVYELLREHNKIVVFSTFKTFLVNVMQPWLDTIGITCTIHQGGSRKKQDKAIKDFERRQDVRVLLFVKQSGVEGHNLQFCNVCVLMDPHFNQALDEQGAQRIDRIGQQKEVIIRKLYMKGSVDNALKVMQEKKKDTSDTWTHNKKKDKLMLQNHSLFLEKYDTVKF
jgi:SNF2 family DNA or RNA helicase